MFLKILAASALTLGMVSGAVAEPLNLRVTPNAPHVIVVYRSVIDHSKDSIQPDGTMRVNLAFLGTTNRSPLRIQCDSSPTTSVMRTNTFDAGPLSDCP